MIWTGNNRHQWYGSCAIVITRKLSKRSAGSWEISLPCPNTSFSRNVLFSQTLFSSLSYFSLFCGYRIDAVPATDCDREPIISVMNSYSGTRLYKFVSSGFPVPRFMNFWYTIRVSSSEINISTESGLPRIFCFGFPIFEEISLNFSTVDFERSRFHSPLYLYSFFEHLWFAEVIDFLLQYRALFHGQQKSHRIIEAENRNYVIASFGFQSTEICKGGTREKPSAVSQKSSNCVWILQAYQTVLLPIISC